MTLTGQWASLRASFVNCEGAQISLTSRLAEIQCFGAVGNSHAQYPIRTADGADTGETRHRRANSSSGLACIIQPAFRPPGTVFEKGIRAEKASLISCRITVKPFSSRRLAVISAARARPNFSPKKPETTNVSGSVRGLELNEPLRIRMCSIREYA